MKVTRILTYNIDENYIRNFFDEDWWEDVTEVDEIEYNCLIDALRDESYDNEEIIVHQNDKERMKQIWQEECDKYHSRQEDPETKKEQILNELQHCKREMEYYKNKVTQLEDWLKDA